MSEQLESFPILCYCADPEYEVGHPLRSATCKFHFPALPWKVFESFYASGVSASLEVLDAQDAAVAHFPFGGQAHATLIVTAVNERPALLARLRAAEKLAASVRKLDWQAKHYTDDEGDFYCQICGMHNGHSGGCAMADMESALAAFDATGSATGEDAG